MLSANLKIKKKVKTYRPMFIKLKMMESKYLTAITCHRLNGRVTE